jgi:nitroimidazol reductase NimA-like FMN-containing flavoprotein (pyridoxamine 5'-phosphate oxidase superfamily)
MTDARRGNATSTVMSADECASRIESIDLGRIAWISDDAPHILPVNYAMDDGASIFRTRPDSAMAAQLPGSAVAFEVDSADFGNLTGWSVVVTGTCRPAPDELARRMTPWADGDRSSVFRIEADAITGRTLHQL